MHKQIEKIKQNEGKPKVLKNIFSNEEIRKFTDLYNRLPITVHNKKQNVIKKRCVSTLIKRGRKCPIPLKTSSSAPCVSIFK